MGTQLFETINSNCSGRRLKRLLLVLYLLPGVVLRCNPRALLQIAERQSSRRKTWKYSRYAPRFPCIERKFCASYLTVSETCLLDQDLLVSSLTLFKHKLSYKIHKTLILLSYKALFFYQFYLRQVFASINFE